MAETIRTFVAVELNDRVKETIRDIQGHLKALGCDISWVKPENAHLTLKFLGDVKTKMIPVVTEAVANVCRDQRPVETTLTGLGFFPDARHPRVLWVGLHDSDGKIAQLTGSLETALSNIGFRKERRPFQAHITIGRIRSNRNAQRLSENMENYPLPADITQNIRGIRFYKSVLTGSGPIYSVLAECPFEVAGPER